MAGVREPLGSCGPLCPHTRRETDAKVSLAGKAHEALSRAPGNQRVGRVRKDRVPPFAIIPSAVISELTTARHRRRSGRRPQRACTAAGIGVRGGRAGRHVTLFPRRSTVGRRREDSAGMGLTAAELSRCRGRLPSPFPRRPLGQAWAIPPQAADFRKRRRILRTAPSPGTIPR